MTQSMESPYARRAPSPQQTVDIFRGQWASKMPAILGEVTTGSAGLFEDPRITWGIERLAAIGTSVGGANILELGPLEGAHTYSFAKAGAASVIAVEGHSGAYLKCLVVKELLGIERVNFLYGDALEFLKNDPRHFDIGVACGFLYHMTNPVELISLLCAKCRSVFLWTVCWDEDFTNKNPQQAGGVGPAHASDYGGFRHVLHRHDYGNIPDYTTFWGGAASHSYWMEFDQIISAFKHFGMTKLVFDREENRFGVAIKLVASR